MDPQDYLSGMQAVSPSRPVRHLLSNRETWTRYRSNVARHLIGISRDLESRVVRPLADISGYQGLRPSFGPFLSLLWDEGQSLTVVADELAITKQACSQLANIVEEAGYVERLPNPRDRRSKVVNLTGRGRSLVREGLRLIQGVDSEYSDLLGASEFRVFTSALAGISRNLGLPAKNSRVSAQGARPSVGILPLIGVRVQRELMKATIARGHPGLKMSHGQVLPLIGADGGRIFEIARNQGVSRQSISMISQDLESLGYLGRQPDPRDRRRVVLHLTRSGEGLIEDSVIALEGLETSFAGMIGKRALSNLKRATEALYQALHLEEEIFGSNHAEAVDPMHRSEKVIHVVSSMISSPKQVRGGTDVVQRLASALRERLGTSDVARLAALLGS